MVSSFQGGRFEPLDVPDFVPQLQESYQKINESFKPVHDQLIANLKTNLGNQEKKYTAIEKIIGKAGKLTGTIVKKRKENEFAVGTQQFYEKGIPILEAKEYDNAIANEVKAGAINNQTALNHQKQGGDIWSSQAFRDLSEHEQLGFRQAYVQYQAGRYNPSAVSSIANATDPRIYNAELSKYRHQFFKQFEGTNPLLLNKYLFPKLRQAENSSWNSWYAAQSTNNRKARLDLETRVLYNGLKNSENPVEDLMRYINLTAPDYGSVTAARNAGMGVIEELVKRGELTDNQLDAIKEGTFTARDGNTYTFEHLYGQDLQDANKAKRQYDIEQYRLAETEKKIAYDKWENDTYDSLIQNEGFTEKDIDELQEFSSLKFRQKSRKLDLLKKDLAVEPKELSRQEIQIKKYADMGALTKERLSEFHWKLQQKYAGVAQQQTETSSTNKLYLDSIEDMVKVKAQTAVDGQRDPSVRILAHSMKKKYRELVESYEITDDPATAHQRAYTEVEKWFNTKSKDLSFASAKGYDLNELKSLNNIGLGFQEQIDRYETLIRDHGDSALDIGENYLYGTEATPFFHKNELRAMEPKPGRLLRVHPRVEWLAKRYDVSPFNILNRQRKALGLPALDEPESIKTYNQLNPINKKALNKAQTHAQYSRAWGSFFNDTGVDFISQIVPEGMGEQVMQASKDLGMDAAEIAAGMDMNLWDSSINNYDIPEDAMHLYWQSVYKYSGGSHPTALTKLMRF